MDKMDTIKKAVLEKLIESQGNVSEACKAAGIARSTFYLWKSEDEQFAQEVDEIIEATIDAVEGYLMKEMKAGNPACIIFFLKTRCKASGTLPKTSFSDVPIPIMPNLIAVTFASIFSLCFLVSKE